MLKTLTIVLFATALLGCSTLEREQEVTLDEVPQIVLDAALGAVQGFVIEEAEIEFEGDVRVYEFEGTANGKAYEIEVSETGEVLEIEEKE